jgi:hypothetical protein
VASAQDPIAPAGAVTSRFCVELVLDGPPLATRIETSAMEEIVRIWAPYGVDVLISTAGGVGWDSDVRLSVKLADDVDPRLARGALGSIRFLDDEPQPAITMYQHAIDALISNITIAGHHELQWPTAFRDVIVGRVLGRALAHEIGHFLLRSRSHPETGLMRAPHSVPDLVAGDRQHFVLSADERLRLISTTSTSFRSSADTPRPTPAHPR